MYDHISEKIQLVGLLNVQLGKTFKAIEGQLTSDYYAGLATRIAYIENKKLIIDIGADEYWVLAKMTLTDDPKIKKPHATFETYKLTYKEENPSVIEFEEIRSLRTKIFIGNTAIVDLVSTEEKYTPYNDVSSVINEYLRRFISSIMPHSLS